MESLAPSFCVFMGYYTTYSISSPHFPASTTEPNSKRYGNIVFYNANTDRDNIEDRYNAMKYVFTNYANKENTYTICVIRYNDGYYFNYIFMKQASGDAYAILEYTYHKYPINIYYYITSTGNITTSASFSDDATLANSLFLILHYTVTFDEIAAGGTQVKNISISKSGYKPIGCVGWANAGSSAFYMYQCTVNNNETLSASIRSVSDSTIPSGASVIVDVLFVKNS